MLLLLNNVKHDSFYLCFLREGDFLFRQWHKILKNKSSKNAQRRVKNNSWVSDLLTSDL